MAHDAPGQSGNRSRILFFSDYPGFSGSHRMALQVAVACRDAGHHVVMAAPSDFEILDRAKAEGIPAIVIEASPEMLQFEKAFTGMSLARKISIALSKLLPFTLRARKVLRAHNIDIVYAAQERAALQVGFAARLARIPVLWHIQSGLLAGQNSIHRLVRRLSDRMVCVSRAVAEDCAPMLGLNSADAIGVIPNTLPDYPAAGTDSQRGRNGSQQILFAGTLVPDKGPHHLLDAVSQLVESNDCEKTVIRLAGPAPDEAYLRFLESFAEKAALDGRVEFLGYREDLPDLMKQCDVIVCPSIERERIENSFGTWDVTWKEGCCLVAIEALRAGKPLVVSDTYGLTEIVADGDAGVLVPPGDPAALAAALRDLLTDPESRRRFGESGRNRFEEFYSTERMAEAFLREFEALRRG